MAYAQTHTYPYENQQQQQQQQQQLTPPHSHSHSHSHPSCFLSHSYAIQQQQPLSPSAVPLHYSHSHSQIHHLTQANHFTAPLPKAAAAMMMSGTDASAANLQQHNRGSLTQLPTPQQVVPQIAMDAAASMTQHLTASQPATLQAPHMPPFDPAFLSNNMAAMYSMPWAANAAQFWAHAGAFWGPAASQPPPVMPVSSEALKSLQRAADQQRLPQPPTPPFLHAAHPLHTNLASPRAHAQHQKTLHTHHAPALAHQCHHPAGKDNKLAIPMAPAAASPHHCSGDPSIGGGIAAIPGPQFRRCPVCKVRKNGKCGTPVASPKCLRRIGVWCPRAAEPEDLAVSAGAPGLAHALVAAGLPPGAFEAAAMATQARLLGPQAAAAAAAAAAAVSQDTDVGAHATSPAAAAAAAVAAAAAAATGAHPPWIPPMAGLEEAAATTLALLKREPSPEPRPPPPPNADMPTAKRARLDSSVVPVPVRPSASIGRTPSIVALANSAKPPPPGLIPIKGSNDSIAIGKESTPPLTSSGAPSNTILSLPSISLLNQGEQTSAEPAVTKKGGMATTTTATTTTTKPLSPKTTTPPLAENGPRAMTPIRGPDESRGADTKNGGEWSAEEEGEGDRGARCGSEETDGSGASGAGTYNSS